MRFKTGVCCLLLRTDTTTKLLRGGRERRARVAKKRVLEMSKGGYARVTEAIAVLGEEVRAAEDLHAEGDDGSFAGDRGEGVPAAAAS